jgi:hypothetical protein
MNPLVEAGGDRRFRARPLPPRAAFALDTILSVAGWIVAASLIWPWLATADRRQALLVLVAPHMVLRFIGLSFFVPGTVSEALPVRWSVPAGYGDLVAGVLAIVATLGLHCDAGWATAAVWIFNVWGATDLLFAFYRGARARLNPSSLGAAFYIVTSVVPMLLVSHALVFALLLRTGHG